MNLYKFKKYPFDDKRNIFLFNKTKRYQRLMRKIPKLKLILKFLIRNTCSICLKLKKELGRNFK